MKMSSSHNNNYSLCCLLLLLSALLVVEVAPQWLSRPQRGPIRNFRRQFPRPFRSGAPGPLPHPPHPPPNFIPLGHTPTNNNNNNTGVNPVPVAEDSGIVNSEHQSSNNSTAVSPHGNGTSVENPEVTTKDPDTVYSDRMVEILRKLGEIGQKNQSETSPSQEQSIVEEKVNEPKQESVPPPTRPSEPSFIPPPPPQSTGQLQPSHPPVNGAGRFPQVQRFGIAQPSGPRKIPPPMGMGMRNRQPQRPSAWQNLRGIFSWKKPGKHHGPPMPVPPMLPAVDRVPPEDPAAQSQNQNSVRRFDEQVVDGEPEGEPKVVIMGETGADVPTANRGENHPGKSAEQASIKASRKSGEEQDNFERGQDARQVNRPRIGSISREVQGEEEKENLSANSNSRSFLVNEKEEEKAESEFKSRQSGVQSTELQDRSLSTVSKTLSTLAKLSPKKPIVIFMKREGIIETQFAGADPGQIVKKYAGSSKIQFFNGTRAVPSDNVPPVFLAPEDAIPPLGYGKIPIPKLSSRTGSGSGSSQSSSYSSLSPSYSVPGLPNPKPTYLSIEEQIQLLRLQREQKKLLLLQKLREEQEENDKYNLRLNSGINNNNLYKSSESGLKVLSIDGGRNSPDFYNTVRNSLPKGAVVESISSKFNNGNKQTPPPYFTAPQEGDNSYRNYVPPNQNQHQSFEIELPPSANGNGNGLLSATELQKIVSSLVGAEGGPQQTEFHLTSPGGPNANPHALNNHNKPGPPYPDTLGQGHGQGQGHNSGNPIASNSNNVKSSNNNNNNNNNNNFAANGPGIRKPDIKLPPPIPEDNGFSFNLDFLYKGQGKNRKRPQQNGNGRKPPLFSITSSNNKGLNRPPPFGNNNDNNNNKGPIINNHFSPLAPPQQYGSPSNNAPDFQPHNNNNNNGNQNFNNGPEFSQSQQSPVFSSSSPRPNNFHPHPHSKEVQGGGGGHGHGPNGRRPRPRPKSPLQTALNFFGYEPINSHSHHHDNTIEKAKPVSTATTILETQQNQQNQQPFQQQNQNQFQNQNQQQFQQLNQNQNQLQQQNQNQFQPENQNQVTFSSVSPSAPTTAAAYSPNSNERDYPNNQYNNNNQNNGYYNNNNNQNQNDGYNPQQQNAFLENSNANRPAGNVNRHHGNHNRNRQRRPTTTKSPDQESYSNESGYDRDRDGEFSRENPPRGSSNHKKNHRHHDKYYHDNHDDDRHYTNANNNNNNQDNKPAATTIILHSSKGSKGDKKSFKKPTIIINGNGGDMSTVNKLLDQLQQDEEEEEDQKTNYQTQQQQLQQFLSATPNSLQQSFIQATAAPFYLQQSSGQPQVIIQQSPSQPQFIIQGQSGATLHQQQQSTAHQLAQLLQAQTGQNSGQTPPQIIIQQAPQQVQHPGQLQQQLTLPPGHEVKAIIRQEQKTEAGHHSRHQQQAGAIVIPNASPDSNLPAVIFVPNSPQAGGGGVITATAAPPVIVSPSPSPSRPSPTLSPAIFVSPSPSPHGPGGPANLPSFITINEDNTVQIGPSPSSPSLPPIITFPGNSPITESQISKQHQDAVARVKSHLQAGGHHPSQFALPDPQQTQGQGESQPQYQYQHQVPVPAHIQYQLEAQGQIQGQGGEGEPDSPTHALHEQLRKQHLAEIDKATVRDIQYPHHNEYHHLFNPQPSPSQPPQREEAHQPSKVQIEHLVAQERPDVILTSPQPPPPPQQQHQQYQPQPQPIIHHHSFIQPVNQPPPPQLFHPTPTPGVSPSPTSFAYAHPVTQSPYPTLQPTANPVPFQLQSFEGGNPFLLTNPNSIARKDTLFSASTTTPLPPPSFVGSTADPRVTIQMSSFSKMKPHHRSAHRILEKVKTEEKVVWEEQRNPASGEIRTVPIKITTQEKRFLNPNGEVEIESSVLGREVQEVDSLNGGGGLDQSLGASSHFPVNVDHSVEYLKRTGTPSLSKNSQSTNSNHGHSNNNNNNGDSVARFSHNSVEATRTSQIYSSSSTTPSPSPTTTPSSHVSFNSTPSSGSSLSAFAELIKTKAAIEKMKQELHI